MHAKVTVKNCVSRTLMNKKWTNNFVAVFTFPYPVRREMYYFVLFCFFFCKNFEMVFVLEKKIDFIIKYELRKGF